MFVYPELNQFSYTGSSAGDRLEYILTVLSPLGPIVNIPLVLGPRIDGTGLKPELNDGTDNQMNHFLTAVSLAYDS